MTNEKVNYCSWCNKPTVNTNELELAVKQGRFILNGKVYKVEETITEEQMKRDRDELAYLL